MGIARTPRIMRNRLLSPIVAICLLATALLGTIVSVRSAEAAAFPGIYERPSVFPDAAVNVVILPYSSTSAAKKPLGPTARELTLLMNLDILFSILKFKSVGGTRLAIQPGQESARIPQDQ